MRFIEKMTPPASFSDWVNQHFSRLQSEHSLGDVIWRIFTRTGGDAKTDLQRSLLKEQGHICAFCGSRIGKGNNEDTEMTFSVEHFLRKGNPLHKHLTLDYKNLLGNCNQTEPQKRIQEFPIPGNDSIETIQEIADYLDIEIEEFKKLNPALKRLNPEDSLKNFNSSKPPKGQKTQLFYSVNIHHCNTFKLSNETPIINPTEDVNCELRFRYEREILKNGDPICKILPAESNSLAADTISVLNLNASNLASKRLVAFEKGERLIDDYCIMLEDEHNNISLNDVLNDVYQATDERLDPFCFVTASVLRDFFARK